MTKSKIVLGLESCNCPQCVQSFNQGRKVPLTFVTPPPHNYSCLQQHQTSSLSLKTSDLFFNKQPLPLSDCLDLRVHPMLLERRPFKPKQSGEMKLLS